MHIQREIEILRSAPLPATASHRALLAEQVQGHTHPEGTRGM
jgi:hypothetical protein